MATRRRADVGEVEPLEQFAGALAGPGAGQAGQSADHPQVLLAGLQLVDGRVLAGKADRGGGPRARSRTTSNPATRGPARVRPR